MFYGP